MVLLPAAKAERCVKEVDPGIRLGGRLGAPDLFEVEMGRFLVMLACNIFAYFQSFPHDCCIADTHVLH